MGLSDFLDVSLDTANRFYAWGWRLSVMGAGVTAFGVVLLNWGTRVRDHDFEQQVASLHGKASAAEERSKTLEFSITVSNERAAFMEKDAAEARLKLEKLRVESRGRLVEQEQWESLERTLKGLELSVHLACIFTDPESRMYALSISQALERAGVKDTKISHVTDFVFTELRYRDRQDKILIYLS